MHLDTLIERHLNARGGLNAILKIQSLYHKGTVTEKGGRIIQIEGWRKRPNLLRIQFSAGDDSGDFVQQGIEGWDGVRAWEQYPWRDPRPVYVDSLPHHALRRGAEFDGPLVRHIVNGDAITPLGECVVSGLPVYGLCVMLSDGSTINYYLHKDSYLVAATEAMRPVLGLTPTHTLTLYTDYRPVSHVMFAHYVVETTGDGAHCETFAWTTVEADMPLDDAFFALPSVVLPSEN